MSGNKYNGTSLNILAIINISLRTYLNIDGNFFLGFE